MWKHVSTFRISPRVTVLAGMLVCVAIILSGGAAVLKACPFCNAPSQTFSEEIQGAAAAVIAKLVTPGKAEELPAETDDAPLTIDPDGLRLGPAPDSAKAQFEVVEVLKGADLLKDKKFIDVIYYGQQPKGTKFYISAIDPKDLAWSTPVVLTEQGVKYMTSIIKLPEKGADRLAFFQDYLELEGEDTQTLMNDAYDEFAKAPYAEVVALKDRMYRDKLLTWIQNKDIPSSRRRLYLTMLGVCGTPEDIPALEAMLKSDDQHARMALDALIACYLQLKGPDGMGLIEDLFLKNEKAEYTDTYAAIMALRFHGQETTVIPKDRLKQAMRHMLSRPNLADLVIPDLARWQDWTVIDQLVDLFRSADQEENSWVRVPIVNFMQAVPKADAENYEKAQKALKTLREIDPDAVKRAADVFALRPVGANATRSGDPNAAATTDPPAPPPEEKEEEAEKKETASAAGVDSASPPTDGGQKKPLEDQTITAPQKEPDAPPVGFLNAIESAPAPLSSGGGATAASPLFTWLSIGAGGMAVLVVLMMILGPRRAKTAGGAHTE